MTGGDAVDVLRASVSIVPTALRRRMVDYRGSLALGGNGCCRMGLFLL